jgi:hypothetical protein
MMGVAEAAGGRTNKMPLNFLSFNKQKGEREKQ